MVGGWDKEATSLATTVSKVSSAQLKRVRSDDPNFVVLPHVLSLRGPHPTANKGWMETRD